MVRCSLACYGPYVKCYVWCGKDVSRVSGAVRSCQDRCVKCGVAIGKEECRPIPCVKCPVSLGLVL